MRQSILVISFVAYALFGSHASAQVGSKEKGPIGGIPGGPTNRPKSTDADVRYLAKQGEKVLLSGEDISDMLKLSKELGYFPTGTTNHRVPSISQFQADYRRHFNKDASVDLVKKYSVYSEAQNSSVVSATFTRQEKEFESYRVTREPLEGALYRKYTQEQIEALFEKYKLRMTAGEMVVKMNAGLLDYSALNCVPEATLRTCDLNPNSKATVKDQFTQQADCYDGLAKDLSNTDPECSNKVKTVTRDYRSQIANVKPMDPKKNPGARGGGPNKTGPETDAGRSVVKQ